MKDTPEYFWSFDECNELWNGPEESIEACIEAANEENKCYGDDYTAVYVGEGEPFSPSVDAGSVLEQIEADASEFCEIGNDWCAFDSRKDDLSDLDEKLTAIVSEWLAEHKNYPDFYRVVDWKLYPLNQMKS